MVPIQKSTTWMRDKESTQGGYFPSFYLDSIEHYLHAIWKNGTEIMQGNAPIHTVNITESWVGENGNPLVNLLPYSPD